MKLNRFVAILAGLFLRRKVKQSLRKTNRAPVGTDKASPVTHKQANPSRQTTKRARQAARITRRIGR